MPQASLRMRWLSAWSDQRVAAIALGDLVLSAPIGISPWPLELCLVSRACVWRPIPRRHEPWFDVGWMRTCHAVASVVDRLDWRRVSKVNHSVHVGHHLPADQHALTTELALQGSAPLRELTRL